MRVIQRPGLKAHAFPEGTEKTLCGRVPVGLVLEEGPFTDCIRCINALAARRRG